MSNPIPVYAPHWIQRGLLEGRPGIRFVADLESLRTEAVSARVVVVVVPAWPECAETWTWLRHAMREGTITTLLCVAPFEAHTARALAALPGPVELVWEHDALTELEARIREQVWPQVDRILDLLAHAAPGAPPGLRTALQRLCACDGPGVSTVGELLRNLGGSEGAQRRAWRCWFGDISPKEIVDWVLLLKALRLNQLARSSPIETALLLGVHERRLDRIARRLVNSTYASLRNDSGLRTVGHEFLRKVRPYLCGCAAVGSVTSCLGGGQEGDLHKLIGWRA